MIHAAYTSSEKEAASDLPRLGLRFLVDSNNVNRKPQNCEADPQENCASWLLTMSLHNLAHFFSVVLLTTKFVVPNVLFSRLWQHGKGKYNVPTAAENLQRESLWHKIFSGKSGEIRAKYPLHPRKVVLFYTYIFV